MTNQMPYEFLEHTADIRLLARGRNFEELFANSGLGMMEFLFGSTSPGSAALSSCSIEISSSGIEPLLVDWLSALLLKSLLQKCAFARFEFKELRDTHLTAMVYAYPAVAQNEIKAVTYHDLKISKTRGFWEAVVTFDI